MDFDAIEVINNSSAFAIISNAITSLVNVSIGFPQLGVSDAHTKEFVGKGYTEFQGKSAIDLKSQINEKKATAHFNHYSLWEQFNVIQSIRSFYLYFLNKQNVEE